jgi:hypothetical protein
MTQQNKFAQKVKRILLVMLNEAEGANNNNLAVNGNVIKDNTGNFIDKVDIQEFIRDVIEAKQNGEIESSVDPKFAVYMLGKINDYLKDENLLEIYDNRHDALIALVNFFFKGISSR